MATKKTKKTKAPAPSTNAAFDVNGRQMVGGGARAVATAELLRTAHRMISEAEAASMRSTSRENVHQGILTTTTAIHFANFAIDGVKALHCKADADYDVSTLVSAVQPDLKRVHAFGLATHSTQNRSAIKLFWKIYDETIPSVLKKIAARMNQ